MVIATVLDPTVIDSESLSIDLDRKELEHYLKGVQENGLIIVDSNGRLESAIATRVRTLADPKTIQVQIRITELLKEKRRIIHCQHDCSFANVGNIAELIYDLSVKAPVDVVVVSGATMDSFVSRGIRDQRLVKLQDWTNSEIEHKRRRFLAELPPMNELSREELEDILVRSIRYSKTLRIFDKQIGQCKNLNRFMQSICYILDIWNRCAHFEDRTFEIITLQKREIESPENEEAHRTLLSYIDNRLQSNYKIPIRLFMKKACPPLAHAADFHARHLQSDYAVLLIERGFDFLKKDGTFHVCPVVLRNADRNHLNQYYNLPNHVLNPL